MTSASSSRRTPDWGVAAVCGLAAGAVLMVLDMIFSSVVGDGGPWRTSHMIAPIFLGPEVLKAPGYHFSVGIVAVALAAHYALGIVLSLVLVAVLTPLNLDETFAKSLMAGVVFGVVLYLMNFHGLARWFPWLRDMLGWPNLAAHIVYGVVAAVMYWKLERTRKERLAP